MDLDIHDYLRRFVALGELRRNHSVYRVVCVEVSSLYSVVQ